MGNISPWKELSIDIQAIPTLILMRQSLLLQSCRYSPCVSTSASVKGFHSTYPYHQLNCDTLLAGPYFWWHPCSSTGILIRSIPFLFHSSYFLANSVADFKLVFKKQAPILVFSCVFSKNSCISSACLSTHFLLHACVCQQMSLSVFLFASMRPWSSDMSLQASTYLVSLSAGCQCVCLTVSLALCLSACFFVSL